VPFISVSQSISEDDDAEQFIVKKYSALSVRKIFQNKSAAVNVQVFKPAQSYEIFKEKYLPAKNTEIKPELLAILRL
jgi:hypothetical protein